MKACWSLFGLPFSISPASVVTDRPTAACACVTHDLTDSPSMWTVQEPHCDLPQPNFRPCMSRSLVRTNKSEASAGASTETSAPLSLKFSIRSSLGSFAYQGSQHLGLFLYSN